VLDDTYPPLAAWLYDDRVAQLHFDGVRGAHLVYTASAIERYGVNGLALSASLPVRTEPYLPQQTAPYLDRLLPEGAARSLLEQQFHVPRGDTFHLLEALGRDCAGAVVIIDADDPLPEQTDEPSVLTDGDVAARLDELPLHPLGVDERVRLSLAGMQAKLLVTQLPSGDFALPIDGAPSTHIIKPAIEGFSGLCANEAWCLALARNGGLTAAAAEARTFGHREVLVVERYDRVREDGVLRRVHQEDACQALGVPIPAKYETDDGGPTLRGIADVVRRVAVNPVAELERLATYVTFTVVIGNADFHGRNVSLLYGDDGPRLAPLYDAICTVVFDSVTPTLAMRVGGADSVESVTSADIVTELTGWQLPRARAISLVGSIVHRLHDALDPTTAQMPAAEGVADVVRGRIDRLRPVRPGT
jgi:serine/threonine-protein kinase HipA